MCCSYCRPKWIVWLLLKHNQVPVDTFQPKKKRTRATNKMLARYDRDLYDCFANRGVTRSGNFVWMDANALFVESNAWKRWAEMLIEIGLCRIRKRIESLRLQWLYRFEVCLCEHIFTLIFFFYLCRCHAPCQMNHLAKSRVSFFVCMLGDTADWIE